MTELHNKRWVELLWDCIPDESSEFGRTTQALLHLTLLMLKARVLQDHWSGHPDFEIDFKSQIWRLEAAYVSNEKNYYDVEQVDLDAIAPRNTNERGFIALLDMHFIPAWLLIDLAHLHRGSYHIIHLKALQDKEISQEINQVFQKAIEEYGNSAKGGSYEGVYDIIKNHFHS